MAGNSNQDSSSGRTGSTNSNMQTMDQKLEEELKVKREQLFKQLEDDFNARQEMLQKQQEIQLKQILDSMQQQMQVTQQVKPQDEKLQETMQ